MLKTWSLCFGTKSNLRDRGFGEVENNTFIALSGKGWHSRCLPWKTMSQPARIWWGVLQQVAQMVKASGYNAGDLGLIPGLGRYPGEGNGNPLQYSCLENRMDRRAWLAAVHGVAKSQTGLSDFAFTFHFHASGKEMATTPVVIAWRIPGTGEPSGLRSMGSHRVRHNWSDLQQQLNLSPTGICEIHLIGLML